MALPGREKTFALENCRGLLEKLRREIKRFDAAEPDDVEARIDLGFNIVVTAWHLCDWVFADLTPDQKSRLKISSLLDLQTIALQCRALTCADRQPLHPSIGRSSTIPIPRSQSLSRRRRKGPPEHVLRCPCTQHQAGICISSMG